MKIGRDRPEDREVENYLRKAGFKVFSSDGDYFTDRQGKHYGAWADLAEIEKRVRENGGERHFIAVRGVRNVKPEEDIFQLLYDESYCFMGKFHTHDDVRFLGTSPSPTYYNSAVVAPIATWRAEGCDGGSVKALYSVLMLKYRIERREEFHRDETEEEKRLRAIEESMEPY